MAIKTNLLDTSGIADNRYSLLPKTLTYTIPSENGYRYNYMSVKGMFQTVVAGCLGETEERIQVTGRTQGCSKETEITIIRPQEQESPGTRILLLGEEGLGFHTHTD